MAKKQATREDLIKEIKLLKRELAEFRAYINLDPKGNTVSAPKEIMPVFKKAQKVVGEYFRNLSINPEKGMIEVEGQRYVLVRASALSYDFLNTFKKLYADRGEDEAINIANNFLFDMAHLIGMEDAKNFHKRMNLKDPIEKMSAGPVHFAYTGWAFVDILAESKPSPDEHFFLKYNHPFSFEADSWLRANKKSKGPVCIMNAGYSSGWCEESFGIPLTAVEITCKARGDADCTFIMAPPDKIESYLGNEKSRAENIQMAVPTFMERKKIEEELRVSLKEKEVLLKEIHHRVKNNLQVISSLLNLQSSMFPDKFYQEKFKESIGRIRSMATIHELLYREGDLSNITIREYFESLVKFVSSSYSDGTSIEYNLNINSTISKIEIDRAIPCGLILNELLSNCLKYAFKGKANGKVVISFSETIIRNKQEFEFLVQDDGVGFSKDIDLANPQSFGLQIVNSLVDQLAGSISIDSPSGTGTKITIRF